MAGDNPQGTVSVEPASEPKDVFEAVANDLLDDDPIEDTEVEEADEGDDVADDEPDEGEPTDEDDADAEDGGQPRDEKGRFLSDEAKVRLDDGTVVTLKDLKQGSLRQADYTRKTQEIAEQRRSADDRNRRVEQLESQLAAEREYATKLVQAVVPEAPVYDPSDPVGYMEQKANYDQWQAHLQTLQTQDREAQQRLQQETQGQVQARIQEEKQRLLEAMPALKDEKRFDAFRNDVLSIGTRDYGFTPEELSVTDHRYVRVLHDAIAYRKLQAQKPKAQDKAKGKPPLTPGRRQQPEVNQSRAAEKDRQTLTATGGKGQAGEAAALRVLSKYV